ncbi:hypothetical protein [Streptomyces sp. YGL11-2]|uniref:hypothetical protein n=1 Tax=Streptomyces sp. YGL11-2 TaxID=3414028 RepID=UPI003CFB7360
MHPDAFDTYKNVLESQREELTQIQSKLSSVTLSSDAFGHLPDAQNLFTAYEEHATAERQNLPDLMAILQHAAEGLHATSESYQAQDSETAAGFGGGH